MAKDKPVKESMAHVEDAAVIEDTDTEETQDAAPENAIHDTAKFRALLITFAERVSEQMIELNRSPLNQMDIQTITTLHNLYEILEAKKK